MCKISLPSTVPSIALQTILSIVQAPKPSFTFAAITIDALRAVCTLRPRFIFLSLAIKLQRVVGAAYNNVIHPMHW